MENSENSDLSSPSCFPRFLLIYLAYHFSSSIVFLSYSPLSMPTFTARSTPDSSPIITRPNSPISNLRRHPNYYLPGGDLFIQINDTLFCIHSYFFIRESTRWLHFLRHTTQGRHTHDPIVLSHEFNISPPPTPQTFALFLWVFYNPYYCVYDVSIPTWWIIETYASYFGMRNVLDLVDRELYRLEHQQQRSSTSWGTLSRLDGSNPTANTTDDTWELPESPYETWISDPSIDEEISLLLNRRHLEDGHD